MCVVARAFAILSSISLAGPTMDVEQAISSLEESPVSHKDFGFLVVPERLRYSAAHPFHFGPWSKIVFGVGCAISQSSIFDVIHF